MIAALDDDTALQNHAGIDLTFGSDNRIDVTGSVEINAPADFVIFNADEQWVVDNFASKSTNTPFTNETLYGKIYYTICNGEIVYSGK